MNSNKPIMIEKISLIKNLAVFQDFDWDLTVKDKDGKPLKFKEINIIYGRNYSGKTTLSRIFRAFETGYISDKYGTPSFSLMLANKSCLDQEHLSGHNHCIRVFNEDFVRDNLAFIIDPDKDIKPFAVLGKDNTKIEAEIKTLETDLGENTEGKETGLYATQKKQEALANTEKKTYEDAKKGLDAKLRQKAIDGDNSIKYQPNKFGDQNYTIVKLGSDIERVLNKEYCTIDQEKKSEQDAIISEDTKTSIFSLPQVTIQFMQLCSRAEKLLSRKIGESNKIQELLLDSALNNWVKQGVDLHEDKRERCAFCNQIITQERWDEIHAHFDEESKKLALELDTLITGIEGEKNQVSNTFKIEKKLFYSKFYGQIDTLSQQYADVLKEYTTSLEQIITQLKSRKDAITQAISFDQPNDNTEEMTNLFKTYEKLRIKSNNYSSSLKTDQAEARETLRLQEVYDFCQTIGYSDELEKIDKLKDDSNATGEALNKINKEIKEKEVAIDGKKKQLNDETAAAQLVNDYLTHSFGHKFLSLQATNSNSADGTKQVRFEIIRDRKIAHHLSEGECSLIAFCFFIAKLQDTLTKNKNPIIWIDDPISSLDSNHIFFIYSLIKNEIAIDPNTAQLFLSTHNLDFLKYIKRIDNSNDSSDKKSYFIVKRQENISQLQEMPCYMKKYITEFNFLFGEIYRCAKEKEGDENYKTFYNFGNNARKFLEIYLFYKYPNTTSDREKMKTFFGEDPISRLIVDRIDNEYSHLSGGLERGSHPIEFSEMKESALLILKKLEEKDGEQYKALCKSIGVTI